MKADMKLYEKVLTFVKEKHTGQFRRSGEPVINHPIGVANLLKEKGYGLDYQIVGLLHDTIEDAGVTAKELLELTGSQEIVDGVLSLTKTDDMSLEESIENAKKNPYGRVIKGSDRLHNAKTTYKDKNTQEFISGFIFKSMVYYVPALKEVENEYLDELMQELHRLYLEMIPEAVDWVDKKLDEKNIINVLKLMN